jgi:hypothetical protein
MRLSTQFSPVTIVMETQEEWDMLLKILSSYSRVECESVFRLRGYRPSEIAQSADKLASQLKTLRIESK